MPKKQIAITIDEELLQRLDRVSEAREESRSAMIERLVSIGIEDQERLIGDKEATIMQRLALRLMESPRVMQNIAKVLGEEITTSEAEGMKERAATVRRARERGRKERGAVKGG